jgi:hypothetical protein
MEVHRFASHTGPELELDLCFGCKGMWFDRHESLKLSPAAVAGLFRLLHQRREDQHLPLASTMDCPRCVTPLQRGFDVVRSGRYMTYRCARQHGRFSTFSSFMTEKGFVRHMTRPEIDDLAKRVGAIYCTSCGAPVDIRKDHACPYCRAAFALIDPQAVAEALEGYAEAGARAQAQAAPTAIGDALVALERERHRAERERQKKTWTGANDADEDSITGDLLAVGVGLVWAMLKSS